MKRNYIIKSIAAFIFLITMVFFQACEKDDVLNEEIQSFSTSDQSGLESRSNSVPAIWLELQGNKERLADFIKAYGSFDPLLTSHDSSSGYTLYAFRSSSENLEIRSVLLEQPDNLGGKALLATMGRLRSTQQDDLIQSAIAELMLTFAEKTTSELSSRGCWPWGKKVKCPGEDSFWSNVGGFFEDIGDAIGNIGSWLTDLLGDGSGGGGHSFADTFIFSPDDAFFTGHYGNEITPGSGGGGGGRQPQLCERINRETIYPTVFQVQQMVTLFSQNTGIPIYGDPNLHDILDVTCLTTGSYEEFEACAKRSLACYYGYGLEEYLDYLAIFSDDSGDFDLDCLPRNPHQGRDMVSALNFASENDFVTCNGLTQYEHVLSIVESNCGVANVGDLAQAALAAPENGVWINRAELVAGIAQGLNTTPEGLTNLTSCGGYTAEERLDASISEGCGSEEALKQALRDGFEGEEWIDLSSLKEECGCLYELYLDALTNPSAQGGLCDGLGYFDGVTGGGVITVTTSMPSVHPNNHTDEYWTFPEREFVDAITFTGTDGNQYVVINPNICEGVERTSYINGLPRLSRVNLISLLIHEGYHARFAAETSSYFTPPFNQKDYDSFEEIFVAMYLGDGAIVNCAEFGTSPHHEVIIRFYMESIAQSLWEANGRIGTIEHYFYIAGVGLMTTEAGVWEPCAVEAFGIETLNRYKSLGEDLINLDPSFAAPHCP